MPLKPPACPRATVASAPVAARARARTVRMKSREKSILRAVKITRSLERIC